MSNRDGSFEGIYCLLNDIIMLLSGLGTYKNFQLWVRKKEPVSIEEEIKKGDEFQLDSGKAFIVMRVMSGSKTAKGAYFFFPAQVPMPRS